MFTFKHLLAFVTVAEHPSFAEAAEKLFITQPALSTAIKNMEQQVGGLLFSRSTRKVELSPEGRAFLPVAKRLLQDWDIAFADLKASFAMQRGNLVVAAMPSFAESILPSYLNQFHHAYPDIRIRILDFVMEDVIRSVEEGRADLGFVFEPEHKANVEFVGLMQDRFCVIMKASHPLSQASSLRLTDIADYPLVTMNKGSTVRLWIDQAFDEYALKPNILIETYQLGTLGQLLNYATQDKELAVGIVPQLCRQQMHAKNLQCVPLNDPMLQKDVGIISPLRKSLSSAAIHLKKQILNNMTE